MTHTPPPLRAAPKHGRNDISFIITDDQHAPTASHHEDKTSCWCHIIVSVVIKTKTQRLLLTPSTKEIRLTSSSTSSRVLMGAGWLKPSSSSSSPSMRGEGDEEDEEEEEEDDDEELSLSTGDKEDQRSSILSRAAPYSRPHWHQLAEK